MPLLLSPVGTSLLSNQAGSQRSLLFQHANASEAATPAEAKELILACETRARQQLAEADIPTLRKASAELNGIIGVYDGELPTQSTDTHWLIATDTYQGQVAANLLRERLQQHFPNTQVYTPPGLSTADRDVFLSGIKELLKWCDEVLKPYQAAKEPIIFNLTGGFKSLQGSLNTIGMFYADRIVYIFETMEELITIPKLPIRLETDLFAQHAALFLQLSWAEDWLTYEQVSALPELMLDRIDDRCALSTWGTLAWNNAKQEVLASHLIELPRIAYEERFKKDFRKETQTQTKVDLQETIAQVSCVLQAHDGDITSLKGGRSGGILYGNLSGKHKHLGHFRLGQGPRVSCEYTGGVLRLRHFGSHDDVNDHP